MSVLLEGGSPQGRFVRMRCPKDACWPEGSPKCWRRRASCPIPRP